jgi:hypothetical protein
MAYPKIIYAGITLNFSYPPTKKPGGFLGGTWAYEKQTVRHDSTTITGLRQSITERVEQFITLQMEFVPFSDIDAWQAFMDYALLGNTFDFYPDASLPAYTTYSLDDAGDAGGSTNSNATIGWKPVQGIRGFISFTLYLRKVIS